MLGLTTAGAPERCKVHYSHVRLFQMHIPFNAKVSCPEDVLNRGICRFAFELRRSLF